jgi:hypothetical protein
MLSYLLLPLVVAAEALTAVEAVLVVYSTLQIKPCLGHTP